MKEHPPVELAYDIIEPAGGADESLSPIIFLHHMGGSKEFWNNVSQPIADGTKRKCYRVDLREHGDTKWTGYFQVDLLKDDLNLFMETHNIPNAILIGHSIGGWAAGRFAMQHPEKVELLFMEDINITKGEKYHSDLILGFMRLWRKAVKSIPKQLNMTEGMKFAVDHLYDNLSPQDQQFFSLKEDLYKVQFPIKRLEDGSYDVKHNMDSIEEAGQKTELSTSPEGVYEGPTFIVYGNRSTAKVYEYEAEMRDHLPCALFILFDGATHSIHLEYPQKYTDLVVKCILQSTENQEEIC